MELGATGLPASDLTHAVESVIFEWSELSDRRILITGITGFVGRWIFATLQTAQKMYPNLRFDIVGLVRDPAVIEARLGRDAFSGIQMIVGDVRQSIEVDGDVSHIIHGATPASVRSGSQDRSSVLATSILGTASVIELAAQKSVPRVLHLSSGAVYGPQPTSMERLPESWMGAVDPWLGDSLYAEGKRGAEALLQEAARDETLTAVQARLFAFMGPGLPLRDGFAIGNFVADVAAGKDVVVKGDGQTVRSYLHASDMASWLLSLLVLAPGDVPYNVGSPWGKSIFTWAEACAQVKGLGISVGSEPPGPRAVYVPDVENSRLLGIPIPGSESGKQIREWIAWLERYG